MSRCKTIRVEFTKEHDHYLYKYLATYSQSKQGRSGRNVYQRLVANEDNLWPWSVHHPWQSWRERYVRNMDHFDGLILNYQRKRSKNSEPMEGQKRAAEPVSIETVEPPTKRAKLEANKVPRMCVQAQPPPPPPPKLTDVRPPSPPRSNTNTDTDAAKKPSLDLPATQTRHVALEIPPSTPNQPTPPPTDGEPGPHGSLRAVKRIKERPRAPSEVFASEPSSPGRDLAVDDVGVASVTYPRAPPRVVDSLHGRILVDRTGHVPSALPRRKEGEAEKEKDQDEGEGQEKARWPPSRGRTAKQSTTSGQDVEVDAHHPFSQPELPSPPEDPREGVVEAERERGKQLHPFAHVPEKLDGALSDRRTVAAQFSAEVRRPQAESEQHEDVTRNGASPVKDIVPTPPPLALLSDPASKPLKFPVLRTSTQSPFRSGPPAEEIRHPAPRPQPQIKAARHPALSRIRRQTIGHERGNATGSGHEHERGRGRGRGQVPSVDLVTRSSTSARSHSHSSAGVSVPARPPRWSLPAFAHPTPWTIDEPEDAPSAAGSGSGPSFRWAAPSPVYGDILGRSRTPSVGGTSTPWYLFTPARSATAAATNANADADASSSRLDAIPTVPSLPLSPHPRDVPLTASHGLASILTHMSANHGLALSVVEAVYARVGSLRDADEVLRGMREAAEGFGERAIARRVRERRSGTRREGGNKVGRGETGQKRDGERAGMQLGYVAASADGEGSEYSPPETSRAAMWKQQSESASYAEEGEVGGEDGDDEEEEGRAVEEELRAREEENEDGLPNGHHDFSQALLENVRVQQQLERKMGRAQLHRDIVGRFV